MTHREAPPLASGDFDRDAATRHSVAALDAAWAAERTRVLHVRGGQVAVDPARPDELALVPPSGPRSAEHFYLGRVDGRAIFAWASSPDSETSPAAEGLHWRHPFEFAAGLAPTPRELLSVALALSNWHHSAGFSSRDGAATRPILGGWARRDDHGGEHFPRTDPAVIVRVEHEDRLLLGSNVLWETGRFSLLAGFVEAGESAEQAVVREVAEEAGIRVADVEYLASQPWPFPRSLMLGFRARLAPGVDPDALAPDPEEISELRWFTRDELREPSAGLLLPQHLSIARWLIDLWVDEHDEPAAAASLEVGE